MTIELMQNLALKTDVSIATKPKELQA